MSARSRRLAEQDRRDAEAEAAVDKENARILRDAELSYRVGEGRAEEELKSGLLATRPESAPNPRPRRRESP